MIYEYKNFSRGKLTTLNAENGDTFIGCNFTQELPNTEILPKKKNLIFQGCNLLNCIVDASSTIEDCLHIQKSFCSHLNPNWSNLPQCPENCSHVVDSDEVIIDGQTLGLEYHYEDTVL